MHLDQTTRNMHGGTRLTQGHFRSGLAKGRGFSVLMTLLKQSKWSV